MYPLNLFVKRKSAVSSGNICRIINIVQTLLVENLWIKQKVMRLFWAI